MRIRASLLFSLLCVLMMSAPVWGKNLTTKFDCVQTSKLVNQQLKPGNYRFIANESTGAMQVVRNGRVVTHVKGQWVKLQKKSRYSEVLSTRRDIQEVRFAGKKQAIKFPA